MTSHKNNIVISFVIVALLVAGTVLLLRRHVEAPIRTDTNTQSAIDWSSKIPGITAALTSAFPDEHIAERGAVTILSQNDLTGDGMKEALVDMGTGGASVDYVALMLSKDGVPVVADWKSEDGTTGPLILAQGAAALHSDVVGVEESMHAVYQAEIIYDGAGASSASCVVSAYAWDPASQLFEFDKDLSSSIQIRYCAAASKTSN